MDDQVLVGVLHRAADLAEELDPVPQREPVRLAPAVDGLPLDELHGEVGLPVVAHAAVEQGRDVAMIEPRQDPPLLQEAAPHQGRGPRPLHHLDGDALAEVVVDSGGFVHRPHPALAHLATDQVRPEATAFIGRARVEPRIASPSRLAAGVSKRSARSCATRRLRTSS